MSGECGPSASDPVLHLGGYLVHECDHLLQILDFSFEKKYLDMHPVDRDFSQFVRFLVCQNFRCVWVNSGPLRFCTFFDDKVHHEGKVSQSDNDKEKKTKIRQLRRSPKPHWIPSWMEPKPLKIFWKI